MTSAFNLVKGRGMSRSDRTISPLTRTSKQPLRGFSGFIETSTPGLAAFISFSNYLFLDDKVNIRARFLKIRRRDYKKLAFPDRVLNAPQLLQASITTPVAESSPDADFFLAIAFLEEAFFCSSAGAPRLREEFFGGMVPGKKMRSSEFPKILTAF